MGIVDRNRVAVGEHSYGVFMTANLLTHSDLFILRLIGHDITFAGFKKNTYF